MRNKMLKRVLGFIMSVAIVITVAPAAFAASPPEGAQITDIYSPWAEFDIFMAREAYGLGNEGTYSNFRGGVTGMKFEQMFVSLAAAFDLESYLFFNKLDEYLTRGTVIAILYELISEVAEIEREDIIYNSELLAVDYFVENGLIKGRSPGDYQLDEICTVQEMIVFSVRVYEHLVYLTET